ncbi:acetyl-CoA C-acyltransferase [Chromobacterium subtsugae]|uniref:Acetyl-CoA C-acyltransferase n=1 Tax=Chromobacterium subtsugae TaxID=251747 RepID=A0ABS7FF48_9NEIS|nr:MULTISPECIES: acetyl-CoA C-acyltransferase [Chromobacterium]KUM05222.1 acetyl-CoA acetyltransferase [Chromobacterium subtsugae]KZE87638.1 acetyl-CoA acetyltransferase [Chromobacterium sp. F49]MBW7566989.1 acetyl-CoA C-acyltransferase [Chromobacterium subtsugae]MBW8288692.1 acetyl-CoA C-acyltransferase [Chromobacterium subtsugae]OBU85772.1 acetyl-CoA acetyltransferase [Chromobacterium subtsugae]
MQQQEIVIVGMARTAMGGFQGALSGLTAGQLGAAAIRAAVERAGVAAGEVDEVIMGCVLPAGQGQAPARQAALGGGLPQATPCTTINKMCGSGMKAVMMAHDQLLAGNGQVVVAGGMESMSNAPYLMPKARGGLRLGHGEIKDHMFLDGLEDAYQKGTLMGVFAEQCAEKYGFSRQDQDEFAIASLTRAQQAIKGGQFKDEIAAVTVPGRGGDTVVDTDEQPLKANLDKIPTLKPAFKKDGTVTPANSSSISDGGAALVLMTAAEAAKRSLQPIARIVGHSSYAHEPGWFTTAPVHAIEKLLAKTGWKAGEVDLYEINEAFAVVTMAAMHDLKLPHDKVNVHGGACALGHPIGASGARIVISLLSALKQRGGKRGVASLCIGGGEATALAVELI